MNVGKGNNKSRLIKIGLGILVPTALINILFINAAPFDSGQSISGALVEAKPQLREWKPGQILVKPSASLSSRDFDNLLTQHQGKSIGKIRNLPIHVVSVPEKAEEAIVRSLSNNPHIEFAELDMKLNIDSTLVDDPNYGSAWHLPKIQAAEAWDFSKGDGVTIAILDTGVDPTHQDLAAKLVAGWNAVDGSLTTSDIYGHGTSVAGTAAAITNNGVGVAGIAWNSKIMPIRVSNAVDGYAYTSDTARGLTWAADHGAKVANISYAVSGSPSVTSAAQYLKNKGGITVCSAGNNGVDSGLTDNQYIITVAATTIDDVKASWSNYGAFVDVTAPGASILTTANGGSYRYASGTSFSSPATAGVVALIMSANPALSPTQVENVLEQSADKLSAMDFDPYFGYGRVNAARAVQLALTTPASDGVAPTVSILSPSSGNTLVGTVNVDVAASDNISVSQVSLYIGTNLIATNTAAPYSFSLDTTTISDGSYQLKAVASDGSGNQSTSTISVTIKNNVIVDVENPVVAILNPASNSKVSGVVSVKVSASDDVAIAKVQLIIDGKSVATSTSASLSYNWNTKKTAAGIHTIQAIAIDTANKSSTMSIQVTK